MTASRTTYAPSAVIGVLGAGGGAGASILGIALAGAMARLASHGGLVDLRAASGGLDVVCGVEHLPGLRWPDLRQLEGEVDGAELLSQLPSAQGVAVLSHGRRRTVLRPDQVHAVVAGLRGAGVPLVVDLPHPDDPLHGSALEAVTRVLLVACSGAVGAAGAEVAASALLSQGVETWLAIRSGRGAREYGPALARHLDVSFAGVVPHDRTVPADLARGHTPWGRGRLQDFAMRAVRLMVDSSAEQVHR